MCADFVRQNARLADIGTDHAYLPLWLCLNGTCPSAIAADINPDPLSRGQAAIMNFNAEHLISTRLSNGLENIGENEADDFVIAGMGGELIATILDSCTYAKNSEKHFILQPMTKSEVLIKYLFDYGFEILKQDCCTAAGKCYTVLLTSYSGKSTNTHKPSCTAQNYSRLQIPYIGFLLKSTLLNLKNKLRAMPVMP